jgi:tellurite resistance-related uncharacterized protein
MHFNCIFQIQLYMYEQCMFGERLVGEMARINAAAAGPEIGPVAPYRSTPVFNETTLPAALRREYRTRAGVWGVIRVLEGRLRLVHLDPPAETVLAAGDSGLILPEQPHRVEPLGPMRMQVAFYDRPPGG